MAGFSHDAPRQSARRARLWLGEETIKKERKKYVLFSSQWKCQCYSDCSLRINRFLPELWNQRCGNSHQISQNNSNILFFEIPPDVQEVDCGQKAAVFYPVVVRPKLTLSWFVIFFFKSWFIWGHSQPVMCMSRVLVFKKIIIRWLF